jgi:hypothetical protein
MVMADIKVTRAGQEEMKGGLEEMNATVRASQEEMEAEINSIRAELEKTTKNWVEDVLSSVDQRTLGPRKELNT